jgi:hypothetical protein
VRAALAVLDRLLFAFRAVKGHGRTVHSLLGTYKFHRVFSARSGSRQ